MEVHLKRGQALVLPRGWVHNPHCRATDEGSVHLTFAIRERTRYWLCEKLLAHALEDPAFRRILPSADLTGGALEARLEETRKALADFLRTVDSGGLTTTVRDAARGELEFTT